MKSSVSLKEIQLWRNLVSLGTHSATFQAMQARSFSIKNCQLLTKYNEFKDDKFKLTNHKFDETELMNSKLTDKIYYPKKDSPEERAQDFYNEEIIPSTDIELERFKKIEIIKGLITGLFGIISLITGFTVYQKWPALKAWYYKMDEDEFKPSKRIKKEIVLPEITNPKDSSYPGLYIWGDNSQLIANNNKAIKEQRYPIRYSWFDGKILKDVILGETSALAIDSKGNLIQWGKGFDPNATEPQYTIKNENLTKALFSNGLIYALNAKNEILIIPESAKHQVNLSDGVIKRKWYTLYLTKEKKPFTILSNSLLAKDEKIIDISTGKFHLLALTNKNKVYSSSTGFKQLKIKSLGQYGLLQFSQFNVLPAPNVLHDIELLNKQILKNSRGEVVSIEPRKIVQISTGWYHSLALDSNGEVYSFGQNTFGQLGHPVSYDSEVIPFPKKINLVNKHVKMDLFPKVKEIHAAGETSFCTIKPIAMYKLIKGNISNFNEGEDEFTVGFGNNLKGQIGSGHYVHAQFDPIKVKELNKFEDYNEEKHEIEKIKIKDWSSGANHTFITLKNLDVLYWGSNDFAQLGNGKKNKISKPTSPPIIFEPNFNINTFKDLTFSNRLKLRPNQKIIAGETTSAIFYTSETKK